MGGVIPIPDYQEFMLPLLRIAGDGQGALSRKDGETLPAWCPCQARCPKTVVFDTLPPGAPSMRVPSRVVTCAGVPQAVS